MTCYTMNLQKTLTLSQHLNSRLLSLGGGGVGGVGGGLNNYHREKGTVETRSPFLLPQAVASSQMQLTAYLI